MSDTPKVGTLRDRVEIQARAKVTGPDGEAVSTYATVAERWAEVLAVSATELTQANQQVAQRGWKVTLRYFAGLTAQHQFRFGPQVLKITSVLPDQRKAWMVCECLEAT